MTTPIAHRVFVLLLGFSLLISPIALADYHSVSSLLNKDLPATNNPSLQASIALASQNRYKTVSVNLPFWNMTVNNPAAAPGYIFIAPLPWAATSTSPSLLILDAQGELVYYKPIPSGATDFKVQPDGTLSYYSVSSGAFTIMDNTYAVKRTVTGNCSPADAHELQVLTNGNVLLMCYVPRAVDLTSIGGLSNATVLDLVIREINPQDAVVFDWNSEDHFAITDTYEAIVGQSTIDYVHGNAIELDSDGNLMISSRHLSEITKINRQTGAVMWRLGGKNNQFTFLNSPQFGYQHDIRRLANGHISLFNNRTGQGPAYSRAEEYEIDEVNKTVSLVWSYTSSWVNFSAAMGNAQRLPNGNTVIGWGTGSPTLTEVTPTGNVVTEVNVEYPFKTYRAFRFPWHGYPTTPPTTVTEAENGTVAVYVSWNGATEVASWRVEAWDHMWSNTVLPVKTVTVARSGFETRIAVPGLTNRSCYFRTTALDSNGAVLGQTPITYEPNSPGCTPTSTPTKQVTQEGNDLAVYTRWNGTIDVASWKIEAWDHMWSNTVPAVKTLTTASAGFETRSVLTELPDGTCYFRATALDGAGVVLGQTPITFEAAGPGCTSTATPTKLVTSEGNDVAVYTRWNGTTDVASWKIDAWEHMWSSALTPTKTITTTSAGFETRTALAGLPTGTCYFQATALDTSGAVLGQTPVTFEPAGSGCTPTAAPTKVVAQENGDVAVYMKWNGHTQVSSWRVEAWDRMWSNVLTPTKTLTTPAAELETRAAIAGLATGTCYFRATALDAIGTPLGQTPITFESAGPGCAPMEVPTKVVTAENGDVAVYTSWRGATNITSWRIDAWTHVWSSAITPTKTIITPSSGFETRTAIPGLPTGTCYFQATALDAAGTPMGQTPITFETAGPGCPLASQPTKVVAQENGQVAVYTSWMGATNIASWKIDAWTHVWSNALTPTKTITTTSAGFETRTALAELPTGTCYFQATALDTSGTVLGQTPVTFEPAGSGCNLATMPTMVITKENTALAFYLSWNGNSQVSSWRVEGLGKNGQSVAALVQRTNFETRLVLSDLANGTCYFRATAFDVNGQVLGETPATYNQNGPGCALAQSNMIYLPLISTKGN